MDSTSQCRILQCSKCQGDREFFCKWCPCDLCSKCKENHFKDLKSIDHKIVIYREKYEKNRKNESCVNHPSSVLKMFCEPCELPVCYKCTDHRRHRRLHLITASNNKQQKHRRTIETIKSETFFYRPGLLMEIKADINICHNKLFVHHLAMQTKADRLKHFIDKMLQNFDLKHSCFKQKIKMNRHRINTEIYERKYEESSVKPIQFLIMTKKTNFQKIKKSPIVLFHTGKLSMTKHFIMKDVIELLGVIQIEEGEIRHIQSDRLLKMVSPPELHRSIMVPNIDSCDHISSVASDRYWINNKENLILISPEQNNASHKTYLCSGFSGGIHTVNRESELIYIDNMYNISKLSIDMEKITTLIETTDSSWRPRCVYWSSSSGDLLVAIYKIGTMTGKVKRYNQIGQLTQIMQHDNNGDILFRKPRYITENTNGDIVVSDYGAVVVTQRDGRHHFSYTGHQSKLDPRGICTDIFSRILLCDEKTATVQMIDKNGKFLLYLLNKLSGIYTPRSLYYDFYSHCLWVGSYYNKSVCVYRYIEKKPILSKLLD